MGPVLKLQTINLNLGPPTVKAHISDNDTVTLANFQLPADFRSTPATAMIKLT